MTPELVLSPDLERFLATPPHQAVKTEHLVPFLFAARQVLGQELATPVALGDVVEETGSCTTQEITAIIAVKGRIRGLAIYGMNAATALAIVGRLLGSPVDEVDDIVLSGIAELGNVITGRTATLLARQGVDVEIAAPVMMMGAGSRVSTLGIPHLSVPIDTGLGMIEAQIALKAAG